MTTEQDTKKKSEKIFQEILLDIITEADKEAEECLKELEKMTVEDEKTK
jgi:hypothetical protein